MGIFETGCTFSPGGGSGAIPVGSGPFGTSVPDVFAIVQVDVLTPNQLRVSLRGTGSVGTEFTPDAVLNPDSWQITLLDPGGTERLVQTVQLVTPSPDPVVDVFTDGVLSSELSYRLELASGAVAITGCDQVDFLAIKPQFSETADGVRQARDGLRDIANPNLRRDQVTLGGLALGTYIIGSDGDLVQDSGLTGLRKRVIRRVTTAVGGFFHLSDYGVDHELKKLLKVDRGVRLASRIQAQILREPDVVRVRVQVTNPQTAPNVLGVIIVVQAASGEPQTIGIQLDPQGRIVP